MCIATKHSAALNVSVFHKKWSACHEVAHIPRSDESADSKRLFPDHNLHALIRNVQIMVPFLLQLLCQPSIKLKAADDFVLKH